MEHALTSTEQTTTATEQDTTTLQATTASLMATKTTTTTTQTTTTATEAATAASQLSVAKDTTTTTKPVDGGFFVTDSTPILIYQEITQRPPLILSQYREVTAQLPPKATIIQVPEDTYDPFKAFIVKEEPAATASTGATSSGESDAHSHVHGVEFISEEVEIEVGTVDERSVGQSSGNAQTQNSDTQSIQSSSVEDSLNSISGMLEYSLGQSLTSNSQQSQATSNQNSGSASAQTQNSDTQIIQSSNVEESLNSISGMNGKSLGHSLTSNSQQSQAASNQTSGSASAQTQNSDTKIIQ